MFWYEFMALDAGHGLEYLRREFLSTGKLSRLIHIPLDRVNHLLAHLLPFSSRSHSGCRNAGWCNQGNTQQNHQQDVLHEATCSHHYDEFYMVSFIRNAARRYPL